MGKMKDLEIRIDEIMEKIGEIIDFHKEIFESYPTSSNAIKLTFHKASPISYNRGWSRSSDFKCCSDDGKLYYIKVAEWNYLNH